MNTADISMDYSSLEALAGKVSSLQKDFEGLRTALNNLMENLDGQWKGTAQTEFAVSYSKLQPKLNVVSQVLGDYVSELRIAAGLEQDTDRTIADHISGAAIDPRF